MNRAVPTWRYLIAALAAGLALLTTPPRLEAACATDADCDDLNSCTLDVCHVGSGTCESTNLPSGSGCDDGNLCTIGERCDAYGLCGGATNRADGFPCDGDGNPCTTDSCQAGACVVGPALPDGTDCNDGNSCTTGEACQGGSCVPAETLPDGNLCVDGDACTLNDTCQGGVCIPGTFLDSDGDGDSDCEEADCGCDPLDAREVCILPNRIVGSGGSANGEVLVEFFAPTSRKVTAATDDSCATTGTCALEADGRLRCTRGRIWDVCTTDADCDEPDNTCRVVVNWPKPPQPPAVPLELLVARRGRTDILALFDPASVAQGCSQKVDVPLDPSRHTNRVLLIAKGIANGRLWKDRDRLRYFTASFPSGTSLGPP
jgi:hypothetical protein